MTIQTSIEDRIRENPQFKSALHCVDCASCVPRWPDEERCSLRAKYRGAEADARGMNWILQAILNGELKMSAGLADFIFRCTTCNKCYIACPSEIDTPANMQALRRELVEDGLVPSAVRRIFESALTYGNTWRAPAAGRTAWAAGIDLAPVAQADYVLFVGCEVAYDERSQKTARALVQVLAKAGKKVATLGEAEVCCGNMLRRMGEDGLFEHLAMQNIASLKQAGAKTVLTISPHCFHTLKNEYPALDPSFAVEVVHHTQLLASLIASGALKPANAIAGRVTYHDPCYLAKHNSLMQEPRTVLGALGVDFQEMDYSGTKAVCCGGGGGAFWMNRDKGLAMDSALMRRAVASEADIVATACPFCVQNLESANEALGDKKLRVADIAELVLESLG